jgi:error-prone DNA polymerase
VAGLVIARQRPGTAHGTMFLLFEDEFGTINLIVPRAVYERHRLLARAEPLLLARGRLERSAVPAPPVELRGPPERDEPIRPWINVIVRELAPLERFLSGPVDAEGAGAGVRRFPARPPAEGAGEEGRSAEPAVEAGSEVGSSMRAAAPAVQSFAAGRRR